MNIETDLFIVLAKPVVTDERTADLLQRQQMDVYKILFSYWRWGEVLTKGPKFAERFDLPATAPLEAVERNMIQNRRMMLEMINTSIAHVRRDIAVEKKKAAELDKEKDGAATAESVERDVNID